MYGCFRISQDTPRITVGANSQMRAQTAGKACSLLLNQRDSRVQQSKGAVSREPEAQGARRRLLIALSAVQATGLTMCPTAEGK
jgi:hypothetical protein